MTGTVGREMTANGAHTLSAMSAAADCGAMTKPDFGAMVLSDEREARTDSGDRRDGGCAARSLRAHVRATCSKRAAQRQDWIEATVRSEGH